MKRTGFFILGAVLLLPSCAVTNSRYQQRSGETLQIDDGLICQTPTVVDLKVNPSLVSIDTVWYDVKGQTPTFGVTSQTNAAIGRLLEIHGGDVLVQPQTCWTTESKGFWEKTHHLKVTGYVGKYENFRTASQEDIDLINYSKHGPKPSKEKPVEPQTAIYVNSVQSPGMKPVQSSRAMQTTGAVSSIMQVQNKPAREVKPKKIYHRKTGFKIIASADVLYSYRDFDGAALSLSAGNQADKWFLGIGASYFGANNQSNNTYHYDYDVSHYQSYPLYVHARRYIGRRMFAPIMDLKLGARFCQMDYYGGSTNNDVVPFIEVGVGISIGAFALGISYDWGSHFDGPVRTGIDSPSMKISLQF